MPETIELPEDLLEYPDRDHDVFDDLSVWTEPRYARLAGMGFQSLLRVPILLDGRFAGALIFLSTSLSAFRHADSLVARRRSPGADPGARSGTRGHQACRRGDGARVEARSPREGANRRTGRSHGLFEAELFGYERGAFTGATQSKPGQLEQAAGGTLFLDEVGEMSLPAQAKFLRVLQEREFQRLGGTRLLRTDARIVAATNRDLQKAIDNGHFREVLFYRLNVFAIRLPPLRERRDDILPLTQAFLTEFSRSFANPPAGLSREAKQMLLAYHWPGNIRELRNVLERAAILCDGGLITDDLLALPATTAVPGRTADQPSSPSAHAPGRDLQSIERTMIQEALQNARFNKSKAAKELGLTRHQLYIRMRRHGLTNGSETFQS